MTVIGQAVAALRSVSRVSELMLRCTRVMNEQLDYHIVQFLGP